MNEKGTMREENTERERERKEMEKGRDCILM